MVVSGPHPSYLVFGVAYHPAYPSRHLSSFDVFLASVSIPEAFTCNEACHFASNLIGGITFRCLTHIYCS